MNPKKIALGLLVLTTCLVAPSAAGASSPEPAFQLTATPLPTNFAPGSKGEILLVATNVGAALSTAEPITITDTLPAGLTPTLGGTSDNDGSSPAPPPCVIVGQAVTCTDPGPIHPGRQLFARIFLTVDPGTPAGALPDEARIEGGGALGASTATTVTISQTPAPFDFLPGDAGLSAPLSDSDGTPATQAGSHPYQLTVNLGFPTEIEDRGFLIGAGHLRDANADLPRGLIIDPAATPVLCTEAELVTEFSPGCPDASQIGTATIITVEATVKPATVPLYNMVSPPGAPASFGFNALGIGVFPHILGAVRSDGDYGLSGASRDILALAQHPIFGIRLDFWGDPSSPAHDDVRGICFATEATDSCPVAPQSTAFLTTSGECSGQPSLTAAQADSWEEPNVFKQASYESADLEGSPVTLSGCGQLDFEPTIEARPTTNLIDSPSGLDVDLHQPTDAGLGHRSPPPLRDATVTLPEGMAVNPSQADGLAACSSAQIGLITPEGSAPAHFDRQPQSCPAAARLGSVEVTTPLLVQRTEEGTKLALDPETHLPIPHALPGSLYLAKPYQNPFGSLLALYLTVEDPQTGTVAKLAGKVEPDPNTGRLTTVFEENPQLPIEDIRLHLFGGARGSLITPPTCATHTSTTDLVPWSSPEGADAHPTSSFQTTAAPGGGACPSSAGAAPNAPAFSAGTLSPAAGAYSPFVLKVSREDGSARIAGIDTTLAPGLTGKLAGVGECSEAQLAGAKSREHPNKGILERESPSCPASSEVGTVTVAAGAGPTPFHTTGHAYLAGPYKGAPLSLAVIVPAVAGPFDLGNVVSRVALYVNPETAQIHAVSDPLPQIIDGIPLDVRSIALTMGRPQFTLNPTSCDEMQILGAATSALGQIAPLTQRFQVGGCSSLAFKPKLSLKLTGPTKRSGNPALRATLTMPAGGANVAKASVALPHSEFLDQAHIRTVCTRVQFAAGAGHGEGCPPGSVYGHARAITPLLDNPLEGPVYLRSSSHPLPDLVAALNGQIDVDLDGRVDSVRGGIRNSFDVVPDAPVSKFVLTMQGGKKGLLENSTNLCKSVNRATVQFTAQNGKISDYRPLVRNSCKKGKHGHGKHKKGRHGHHKGR